MSYEFPKKKKKKNWIFSGVIVAIVLSAIACFTHSRKESEKNNKLRNLAADGIEEFFTLFNIEKSPNKKSWLEN